MVKKREYGPSFVFKWLCLTNLLSQYSILILLNSAFSHYFPALTCVLDSLLKEVSNFSHSLSQLLPFELFCKCPLNCCLDCPWVTGQIRKTDRLGIIPKLAGHCPLRSRSRKCVHSLGLSVDSQLARRLMVSHQNLRINFIFAYTE